MIRTSYGVRFFERAYARFSCDQLCWKACSCRFASWAEVVRTVKSYVAGKRKPSSGCLPKPGMKRGRLVAARYVFEASFGFFRSEEHTSELQSRFGISYAVFCLTKK